MSSRELRLAAVWGLWRSYVALLVAPANADVRCVNIVQDASRLRRLAAASAPAPQNLLGLALCAVDSRLVLSPDTILFTGVTSCNCPSTLLQICAVRADVSACEKTCERSCPLLVLKAVGQRSQLMHAVVATD